MPKEYIDSHQFISETSDDPGPKLAVSVGWSRETGEVQIATVDRTAPSTGSSPEDAALERFFRTCIGPMVTPQVTVTSLPPGATMTTNASSRPEFEIDPVAASSMVPGVHTGWYVSLDRRQINDLIVLLRKVRDAAFGKDA